MRPRYLEVSLTSKAYSGGADRLIEVGTPSVNTVGFTLASHVFTATIPGLYLIKFRLSFSEPASGTVILDCLKNGSTYSQVRTARTLVAYSAGIQFWIELAVGDTLAFYCNDTSGFTVTTSKVSTITMELL